MRVRTLVLVFCGMCWGRAAEDCKLNSRNIGDAKHP